MSMKSISLFSGAMGLDLGIEQAGFKTAVCVENNPCAVETIKLNRPDLPVFDCSIVDVTGDQLRRAAGLKEDDECPLVVGGPPCQAFSVFGNRLGIEDARGQLVFEYVRIIEEVRPLAFVMENVRGLLSMSIIPKDKTNAENAIANPEMCEKGSLLKNIFSEFEKIGYRVDCFVVNSVNYGAPQIRERLILIGNRFDLAAQMPQPSHSNRPEDKLPPFKTLGEAIGPESGFVDSCSEVMNFSPRKLKYLSMIPPGGNWRSLPEDIQKESMGKSWYLKGGRSAYWRKLSFSFPSPTVVTMPNHAGTSMCHPSELRAITVGEAAATQEFPPTWQFSGKTAAKFKQIGNAVPVRLGKVAGDAVAKLLSDINGGKTPQALIPQNSVIHIRPHVRTRTFWKDGQAFAGDHCYYGKDRVDDKDDGQIALNF